MEPFDPNMLDAGIRDTVVFLRKNGFNTTDSGDGSKNDMECAMPIPNVAMTCAPEEMIAEADRLARLILSSGHDLRELGNDEHGAAEIQASYDPATKSAIILVLHFVVPWTEPMAAAR